MLAPISTGLPEWEVVGSCLGRNSVIVPVSPVESVGLTGGTHHKLGRRASQGQDALIPILCPNYGTWESGSEGGLGDRKWGKRAVGPGGSFLGRGGNPEGGKKGGQKREGDGERATALTAPHELHGLGGPDLDCIKGAHLLRGSYAPPGLAHTASLQLTQKPAPSPRAKLGSPDQCCPAA